MAHRTPRTPHSHHRSHRHNTRTRNPPEDPLYWLAQLLGLEAQPGSGLPSSSGSSLASSSSSSSSRQPDVLDVTDLGSVKKGDFTSGSSLQLLHKRCNLSSVELPSPHSLAFLDPQLLRPAPQGLQVAQLVSIVYGEDGFPNLLISGT